MMALILKDFATLKRSLIITGIICIGLSIYGIYSHSVLMVPLICTMTPVLLGGISFGYDTKCNFERFAFSLPIKKSSYVYSKLFIAFVFGILCFLFMFVFMSLNTDFTISMIFTLSLICLLACILISAIQLPFVLKYGAEKGRLIMVITYFAIFGICSYLGNQIDFLADIQRKLVNTSLPILCVAILFVGMLMIGICIKISITIMENKEY